MPPTLLVFVGTGISRLTSLQNASLLRNTNFLRSTSWVWSLIIFHNNVEHVETNKHHPPLTVGQSRLNYFKGIGKIDCFPWRKKKENELTTQPVQRWTIYIFFFYFQFVQSNKCCGLFWFIYESNQVMELLFRRFN